MNRSLRLSSILVALIALVVGIVGKIAPHLFFKIPNVGFILWAITGHSLPPYISFDMYEEGRTDWLKQNDVIVSVGVKAGTTWMLYCSHQIRIKGHDEKYPFIDPMIATPWPSFVEKPGDTWENKWNKLNKVILPDGTPLKQYWDNPDYPFRIFKAHELPETFGSLVGGDKVKFLTMARNGLDTVTSFVPFVNQHTDEFRALWGGFPPKLSANITKETKKHLKLMSPGQLLEQLHFGYVNSWWKVKDKKNVLLLHFSDVKKDLPGSVSKLAEFYGVELSLEEKATVVEKCSFPHMKKHTNLFTYSLPLNPDFNGSAISAGGMTRKGRNGDGDNIFSVEEKAAWAKIEEEVYGDDPIKLNWARNGGDYSTK